MLGGSQVAMRGQRQTRLHSVEALDDATFQPKPRNRWQLMLGSVNSKTGSGCCTYAATMRR